MGRHAAAEPAARSDRAQRSACEVRAFGNSGEREYLPAIRRRSDAITAIVTAVVRIKPPGIQIRALGRFRPDIRDAMRPRVIADHGYAAREPSLNGKQQAVVAGGSPGIDFVNDPVILRRGGILKIQPAALIDI